MTLTPLVDRLLTLTLPPLPSNIQFYRATLLAGMLAMGLAIAWLPLEMTTLFVGGAILLILFLRQPVLSLYFLIPIIPFSALLAVSLGNFKVGFMEIVLALGLIAWAIQASVSKRHQKFSSSPTFAPLWLPFILMIGSVGFSWLNTLSIGATLIETIKWVEMLALYLLVINLLPAHNIKWVVAMILLAGIAQAALGLYQFIFKMGPEGFLLFNGRFLRAFGTFAQPNPYAGYLGLILPLALSLFIWAFSGLRFSAATKTHDLTLKVPILIILNLIYGLLLAALFASQSRGAWLAFVVAASVTIFMMSRKPGFLLTILITVVASVSLAGVFDWNISQISRTETNTAYDAVTQRFIDAATIVTITDVSTLEVTDANFATLERLAHWQAAREMWRDNFWLGVGFGNYAVVYPVYAAGRWLDPLGHAHNYLLNIGAEAGLIGIIGYLIFWIFALKVIGAAIQRSEGFYRAMAVGSLGILIHLHVHNLFDNLYVQGMYLHIAIILALVSIIYQRTHEPVTTPP